MGKVDTYVFKDPIHDGAADPVVFWNYSERCWFMYYTNRRANAINHGVSFLHGTHIGVACSNDGINWLYRGHLKLEFEKGTNTFWAPEIFIKDDIYHMYVSYVKGVPISWKHGRQILHYTSKNAWDWQFESSLKLSSEHIIDACVFAMPDGKFKMWYKDECDSSHSYAAVSDDLYNWEVVGAEIIDCEHEGPNVFELGGKYWMTTDPWKGLGVYHSDDLVNWTRQENNILYDGGKREDDGSMAAHADILVNNGRAYIYYFTHPEVDWHQRHDTDFVWEYCHRRSTIQVAELKIENGILTCDRDNVEVELIGES